MKRPSMTQAAIRKRKRRAEERESREASASSRPVLSPTRAAVDRFPDVSLPLPEPTMFETVPVAGSGENAFVMSPAEPAVADAQLAESAAGAAPAEPAPELPPLVEPAPAPESVPAPAVAVEAAKPKTNERTVMMAALFVGGFFEAGIRGLLETSPPFLAFVAGLAGSAEEAYGYIPKAVEIVVSATAEVARSRNLNVPYQDEIVVAMALGVGAVGVLRKRRMIEAIERAQKAFASAVAASPAVAAQPTPAVTVDPFVVPMPAPAPLRSAEATS